MHSLLRALSGSLGRRRHTFTLTPLSDLSPADGGWISTGASPQFQLIPLNGRYLVGWVLFETRVIRRSADCSARLILDFGPGGGEGLVIDIPSARTGKVQEVVFFPPGLVGLRWAPQTGRGEIQRHTVVVTEVGAFERICRMVRRTAHFLWRRREEQLQAVGLTVGRMLVDLPGAYRASGLLRAYAPALSYSDWIARFDVRSAEDHRRIARHIQRFESAPHFLLVVVVPANEAQLVRDTLESLVRQLYRQFTVVVLDASPDSDCRLAVSQALSDWFPKSRVVPGCSIAAYIDELNRWLAEQGGVQWVAVIRAGDMLAEHALYWVASVIMSSPSVGLVYSDEDRLSADGVRRDPAFKPDWSPELLRSTNYIGQLALFRGSVLCQAGGVTMHEWLGNNHDLLLRVADVLSPKQIRHIPALLFHRRVERDEGLDGNATRQEVAHSGVAAVEAHLSRRGIRAAVTEPVPGSYRIRYRLPETLPLISLVIPTRDACALLARCVSSVVQSSTFSKYEILVIDNQSSDEETLRYLQDLRGHQSVRVLSYDRPFNYSAINNFAASQAKGEVLCLLNNDTEVISPDWMEEMLGHLIQDRVGVVGAKLYYSDGRVQHAGDVVGVGGIANHLYSLLERDHSGYCHRAKLAQELSAVTGACLMTWRTLYLQLGGLNERHLPVAFNDVDYCLRAREADYRVIWTPYAELYHHESVSRGKDRTPGKRLRARREASYMRSRWRQVMRHDPFYNPNLSHERPDCSLSHAPIVQKPWL
jgi:GT2 family glycosyltransferase